MWRKPDVSEEHITSIFLDGLTTSNFYSDEMGRACSTNGGEEECI
jgi:hypothetical protein